MERAVMPITDRLRRDDHAGDRAARGEDPAGEDRQQIIERGGGHHGGQGLQQVHKRGYKRHGEPPCSMGEVLHYLTHRLAGSLLFTR